LIVENDVRLQLKDGNTARNENEESERANVKQSTGGTVYGSIIRRGILKYKMVLQDNFL